MALDPITAVIGLASDLVKFVGTITTTNAAKLAAQQTVGFSIQTYDQNVDLDSEAILKSAIDEKAVAEKAAANTKMLLIAGGIAVVLFLLYILMSKK